MQNKCFKNKKNRAGFSLLEVMISIFVLAIGLVALITLMSKSLMVSMESRNQIIATQLAQEGIELAINARDTNKLKDDNYDFVNHVINGDTPTIDIEDKNTHGGGETVFDYKLNPSPGGVICTYPIRDFPNDSCAGKDFLRYDPDFGYQYSLGDTTVFRRRIHYWYSGKMDVTHSHYILINTCNVGFSAIVFWGKGDIPSTESCSFSNKCAIAETETLAEKDPKDPKCRILRIAADGGPTSITY